MIFACSQNLSSPSSPDISEFVQDARVEVLNVEAAVDLVEAFRVVSGRAFVTFEPRTSSLSNAAKFTLERQALWLKDNPEVRAQIIGFADKHGSAGKNAGLGASRAQVVRDYLLLNEVSESQLSIAVVDSSPQHASNNENAGRALTVIVS